MIPISKPDGADDRKIGDVLFLWNREGHIEAGYSYPWQELKSTQCPEARATIEGASGVLLEFIQDTKKGKHLWKVLVTLRNGNCVVWTLNAKLFKRGWMSDLDDPVISWPKKIG